MGLFGILTERERNLVNKAIAQEQERIIKLLGKRKTEVGHSLDKIGAEAREYWQIKCRLLEIHNAIALIKGETNE